MIEDKLKEFRSEYHSIETPSYLVSNGWLDLSLKLENQRRFSWKLLLGRGLVFATVVLVLSGMVVGVSQAAKPGDFLFPVKVLSEKVVAKVTNDPTIVVEHRANDLINDSSSGSNDSDKAAEEYQKSLLESKQDAQDSGKTQEFKKALEEQEQKLKDAAERDSNREDLQRAIDETQKVSGEVQGTRDSNRSSEGNHSKENKTPSPSSSQHEED